MTLWQIGCALAPNMASIIVFRLLGGIGGSACLTIGGGIIADLFPIHEHGLGNAVFASGPVLGPAIGPIIGGLIAYRTSRRWTCWVLLCACGAVTAGNILSAETNPSVLISRKAAKLRKELNRSDLISRTTLARTRRQSGNGQFYSMVLHGIIGSISIMIG